MNAPRIDLKDLALRESEQVEWKENVADPDDVAATLCAFANDYSNLGGGYVVCGAREAKDEHGFPRLERTGLTADRLREVEGKVLALCRDRVSPPIVPLVDLLPATDEGRQILVFTMPASASAHQFRRRNEGGKHFVRISRQTLEARNGTLLELLVRKGVTESWDRRPCATATVDDIDLLALREVLQRIKVLREGNGSVDAYLSATVPVSTFIPSLFVAEPLSGILRPRNFAVLLFGRNVQLFVPGAVSFFSVYPGVSRGVSRGQRTELDGTVLSQLDVMLPLLEAQAVTLYDKDDLRQPSVRKYPERALREALVNAFAHRDYQRVEPLRVTAFVDRVEFNSPGSLPLGVRVEDFQRGEVGALWRNQTLAWFLNRLGLAEGEGQGLNTIQETMLGEGCPPPEFQADEVKVMCVLRAHPRATAQREESGGGALPVSTLSLVRQNRVFLGREKELTRLADLLGENPAVPARVAVVGLGGVGKTALAFELASRLRHQFDYVFSVPAASEAQIIEGYAAMFAESAVSSATDRQTRAFRAKQWMETHPGWLLILDGVDAPSTIEPHLPKEGIGKILITSRRQDFAHLGFEVFRLPTLSDLEAQSFLIHRTGRSGIGEIEREAAAKLARELGNLPTELERAAEYLNASQASFADYLASNRRRNNPSADPILALILSELRKTWPASADLLDACAFLDHRAVPDELFIAGGSEISSALAVATLSADPLAIADLAIPLLRYSLIERHPEERSISLHPLVQEAVKLDLGAAGKEILQRVVKAMRHAFPWPEGGGRNLLCERLIPHLFALAKQAPPSTELAWLVEAGTTYLRSTARPEEAAALEKAAHKARTST